MIKNLKTQMLQNKAGLDLTVGKTGGLVSLNFFVKLSMCSHGVLPPKLWGKSFCLSKIFWVGLEIFFIWRGSPYGGLTKMIVKGGFNFKNLTCVFVLSFSQFRKTVYLYNTDCDVICLLLCRNVMFLKFEHGQIIFHVQMIFLYFEYDIFLTS